MEERTTRSLASYSGTTPYHASQCGLAAVSAGICLELAPLVHNNCCLPSNISTTINACISFYAPEHP